MRTFSPTIVTMINIHLNKIYTLYIRLDTINVVPLGVIQK